MKINFINHASAIFDCGKVKILTDPWYTGSVFNESWDLMVDNKTDINKLDFNYLWFSHEHPDHFNVPDVKKIDEEKRKNITVLFQKTEDQKVKKFCESLGLKVIELDNHRFYKLDDVQICCTPVGGFDSWLYINHEGKSVLNLNDCRAENPEELAELKRYLGKIDVLMTQFSRASWVGNEGDKGSREQARKILNRKIDNQINILCPEFIIPFASFCWFSHVENFFCNKDGVTIDEFISRYSEQNIITLFPEDVWEVGENLDCSPAIEKWRALYQSLDNYAHCYPMLKKSKLIKEEELHDSFSRMTSKIREKNDWAKILELKDDVEPTTIYVKDLDKSFIFDITADSLEEHEKRFSEADITMHADSLKFIMDFNWGRGTLMVNGRFRANYKLFDRFLKQTQIYYYNNLGKSYPDTISKDDILNLKSRVFEIINSK